ncbi:PucR family transcriptional regulator [Actinomadura sp. KC345]|uniref:helix-turn-helix domain-containing protein n=1 Tax=Actinomadura sp. KC345 TaxID=2530371 RepID=UPI0010527388|nr:helix-turn-helix domain-containing protein [Actinomadura sp. KC345]TDC52520.1 PucR family transcriptional regulator [Actinomadura sp. KC345]
MTTLRPLVQRPDLDLRFLEGQDEHRHGDRPVAGVVQVDPALGGKGPYRRPTADRGLLRDLLILVPAADAGPERADEFLGSLAGLDVAGVVLCPDPRQEGRTAGPWTAAARRHAVALLTIGDDGPWTCAAIHAAIADERRGEDHRPDRLRDMQREVARPDGLVRLLGHLARLVDGYTVLIDRSGRPRAAAPCEPDGLLAKVGDDIGRVVTGQVGSASVSLTGEAIHVLPVAAEGTVAALVVGRAAPFTPEARRLVGDAARLLSLRWRMDELGRHRARVEAADRHNREAVLHLLMTGQVTAARRVAGALRPELASMIRVYVVECPERTRDEVVARCDEALGGRAWIVRCPVYARHVIVLAPEPDRDDEDEGPEDPLGRALRAFAVLHGDVRVGAGPPAPLIDTATGWEQAFHALTVARNSTDRFARFNPRGSLAGLLGLDGRPWALTLLRPLLDHRPGRPQDPGAAELTETLRSWLGFQGGAAAQLKIHRNTLPSRLRRIEDLLMCDLARLAAQAELSLALQLLDHPGGRPSAAAVKLDELLDSDDVRHWAGDQLHPLLRQDSPLLLSTLRSWLDNDASMSAAAAAMRISAPGLRKRLRRIEELIERSLLAAPSARYDLWIALRVHDRK